MSITLKEFRKRNQDLKGKRILLCEHLRNKSIDLVDLNLFLGDNTRLLLCPVCQKYLVGLCMEFAFKLVQDVKSLSKDIDSENYHKWLAEAGKEKS